MTRTAVVVLVIFGSAAALAAPLTPTINGHDFGFGAYNADQAVEYATNGTAADTLMFTSSSLDHEVTAYWPNWPSQPALPVWDLLGVPNFGGDFVVGVEFTGQDAPYSGPGGKIDVSLTGTGVPVRPGGYDLEIWGTVVLDPNTVLNGLLWAIDLDDVSLYGFSDDDTYVLEGIGTIVNGGVAEHFNLIGQAGAMRGHLDFVDRPIGWIMPEYDPKTDVDFDVRAAYSGETGRVPEPASMGLALLALATIRRR